MKYKRTLVIGDIHGNCKALNDALEIANFDIEKDRVICIGDYVDGWGESFEVVRTLLEIQNNSKFENTYLLGNHDKWFLDILLNDFENLRDEDYIKRKYLNWYIQGGKQTLESYLKYDDEFIKIHLVEFFKKLKYYHVESNKLFVHAGFDPEFDFKFTLNSNSEDLIWNRSLFKEGLNKYLMNQNLIGMNKKPIDYKFDNFDKIYIGHTPTTLSGLDKPIIMGNLINIDQGCKKKGRLTIWEDETNRFYQTKEIEKG